MHTPATWQQPANREDRHQWATSTDRIRNAYRCANGEKQINEQQLRFSALPPAPEVALCGFSQSLHSNSMLEFFLRYTLVDRSVGSPQETPIKQSAVCATGIYSSPLLPH